MSDTVFFLILIVSAILCYVFGDILVLPTAVVVGLRVHAATDSVLLGILAAIAAGGVYMFFAWLGSRAKRRLRARAYLEQTPEGQEQIEARLATLLSYGALDGSEGQRKNAAHLLQTLASRIERAPEFTIDQTKAVSLLHDLEPRQPSAAFAVLYSLAVSTTHCDSRVVSDEDTQIAASEFWRSQKAFLASRNHGMQERMRIEMLMFSYYFDLLEVMGEQRPAEPAKPDDEPDLETSPCDDVSGLDDPGGNTEYLRARALHDLGRYEEALAAYDRCLELRPVYGAAHFDRGKVLHDLGRYDEAVASYVRYVKEWPLADLCDAYCAAGKALLELRQFEDALAVYDHSLEIRPDDGVAHSGRGDALGDLRRDEEAVVAYDRSLEIRPDDADTHGGRGFALNRLGRKEEAVVAWYRWAELQPDDVGPYQWLGETLHELGRYEEAVAAYDRLLELDPNHTWAPRSRDYALYGIGPDDDALAGLERALQLRPDDAYAHRLRGEELWRLQRHEEALEAYDRSLQLRPDDAHTHRFRGLVLADLGRYEEALAAYDRSLQLRPDDTHTQRNRDSAFHAYETEHQVADCAPDRAGRDASPACSTDEASDRREGTAVRQITDLINVLAAKTSAGKAVWNRGEDEGVFEIVLGDLIVQVASWWDSDEERTELYVRLLDGSRNELETMWFETPETIGYEEADTLWELARRSALNVDVMLDKAFELLDSEDSVGQKQDSQLFADDPGEEIPF